MKVFNNPHFHSKGSSSKPSSLQSSRVGGSKIIGSPQGQEQDLNEMLQSLNPTQIIAQEEESKFDLIQEMQQLKTKVLGLLKKYQVMLQNENAKQVKSKIKSDVQEIQIEYEDIIAQYQIDQSQLEIENNIPTVQKEKELNTYFNLVEEFLERFSHHKATLNYFSILQQEKMNRNGLGVFSVDQDGRQSMYDFQEQLPDLTDSNNSENTHEAQQAKIALSNSQKLRSQIRRRFFDLALKVKEGLPLYHPGRQILVSILFEDAEEEGIDENEWESWIVKQLNK
ncbi:unnamed protein product [Paramecium primaurelia]|uniref:Uncharacterized protein n=1 Tax=Paramecium primaurelia TaxID=5886 RepID=A0A8S1K709_PARPR|nr:unnamed protein product [Paramecium primaurelia]